MSLFVYSSNRFRTLFTSTAAQWKTATARGWKHKCETLGTSAQLWDSLTLSIALPPSVVHKIQRKIVQIPPINQSIDQSIEKSIKVWKNARLLEKNTLKTPWHPAANEIFIFQNFSFCCCFEHWLNANLGGGKGCWIFWIFDWGSAMQKMGLSHIWARFDSASHSIFYPRKYLSQLIPTRIRNCGLRVPVALLPPILLNDK